MPTNLEHSYGPLLGLACASPLTKMAVSDNNLPIRPEHGSQLYVEIDDDGMDACASLNRESVVELRDFLTHWIDRTGPFAGAKE